MRFNLRDNFVECTLQIFNSPKSEMRTTPIAFQYRFLDLTMYFVLHNIITVGYKYLLFKINVIEEMV